jgi:O-antigen/teichoic acid export membrane protein
VNIARSTALNLAGMAAPLPLALLVIPFLVGALGTERFGVLTLIWALSAYLGLFDLGLGRALTQQLAIALHREQHGFAGTLSAAALAIMAIAGCAAALLLACLAPALVLLVKQLSIVSEVVASLRWIALALPFIVVTAGLRGMLEACHAFDLLNYVRIPLGLWTLAAPCLAVAVWGPNLVAISALLAVGRVVGCAAHALLAWRALPQLHDTLRWRADAIGPLLRSGGWLSLSSLVLPLVAYADRFALSMVVGAGAVAYYATPQEVVLKLWILPGALTAALFPRLAAQIASRDASVVELCHRALLAVIAAMLPIALALALFADELLNLWLGAEFAASAAWPAKLFAMGMFANALAQLPFTALQSGGRAVTTAVLHAVELPLYVAALVWAGSSHGIVGIASVWALRNLLDAVVLFASARALPTGAHPLFGRAAVLTMLASALAFVGMAFASFEARLLWLLVATAVVMSFTLPRLLPRT